MQASDLTMKNLRSQSTRAHPSDTIVIAGCSSPQDSLVMARWLFSEMEDWPRTAWHSWITDASDCAAVRAAVFESPRDILVWQKVTPGHMEAGHAFCRVLGGRYGLGSDYQLERRG